MEKLTEFKFNGRGRPKQYDYDTLLDGGIYRLTQGTDFTSQPTSFLGSLRKEAASRGVSLSTTLEGDTTVVVQAREKGSV